MKINSDVIVALDSKDSEYFSWSGCHNCANGLGSTIIDCKAFFGDLTDHYDIRLCGNCLIQYHYGEAERDVECTDKFKLWEE